jgi:hypothetical protein
LAIVGANENSSFFDETGGEAPTDYIFNKKSNQKQYSQSRNKKKKGKKSKKLHISF